MTEAAAKATTSEKPENWKERLADLKYRMTLAHDGVQVEKDMRRHAVIERLIKKTQDGTLQQATDEPMDKTLDEDMAVRIGDESHIHYHNAPSNETTTTSPPTSQTKDQPKSSLAKTAATIGLATALGGVGLAAPIAAYNLTKPAPQNTTIVEDPTTDTNTKYGLRIYRDEQQ